MKVGGEWNLKIAIASLLVLEQSKLVGMDSSFSCHECLMLMVSSFLYIV